MKITKHKMGPGHYGVRIDGRPTGLLIAKDTANRRGWGAPQEWDVYDNTAEGGAEWLFTAKGLESAVAVLETLARHLDPKAPT